MKPSLSRGLFIFYLLLTDFININLKNLYMYVLVNFTHSVEPQIPYNDTKQL